MGEGGRGEAGRVRAGQLVRARKHHRMTREEQMRQWGAVWLQEKVWMVTREVG